MTKLKSFFIISFLSLNFCDKSLAASSGSSASVSVYIGEDNVKGGYIRHFPGLRNIEFKGNSFAVDVSNNPKWTSFEIFGGDQRPYVGSIALKVGYDYTIKFLKDNKECPEGFEQSPISAGSNPICFKKEKILSAYEMGL